MDFRLAGYTIGGKMRIEATGKKNGKSLIIVVEDGKFTFNGKEDSLLKRILDADLKLCPVFAGTYIPEDAYEDVNILNVLENYFFDGIAKIKAEGIKPMESESDKIY